MLKSQPIPPVPEITARAARAAFPKGHRYLTLRDELGTIFTDNMFADLFPKVGQPAEAPWRLALVLIVQHAEGLSDREAADAVRDRITLRYLLSLEYDDPGFDYSILSRFRQRLVEANAENRLLNAIIEKCRQQGLLKERGKARTDSTRILASVRRINRLELIGETLRATLNRLAVVAPEWLQEQVDSTWYQRYAKRFEKEKKPRGAEKETALAEQIGRDGIQLMTALYHPDSPRHLAELPEVEMLRCCWIGQFWFDEGTLKWREKGNLQPAAERLDSPYDPEAHYGKKGELDWVGYKVHFTETCDDNCPHLVTHVDTTAPVISDIARLEPIHEALHEKNLLPAEHLVDSNYVNSALIVKNKTERDLELLGPLKPNAHKLQIETGFDISQFSIDWDNQVATCPMGKKSINWWSRIESNNKEILYAKFSRTDCRKCSEHALCTSNAHRNSRKLTLKPQAQHEAIIRNRKEQTTPEWIKRYNHRAGIEGTFSQGVRAAGLRRSRYTGLAKTHLQNTAIASAINFQRLADWFDEIPRAQTRTSRFARLRA